MRTRRKTESIEPLALALAACLTLEGVAVAEPENVHIEYVAPVGCPDATAFFRALRRRTTQFRRTETDDQARKFLVRVTAVSSSFSGRLEIRNADGSTAFRGVDGPLCAEVSDALALMTALAIDPNALTSSPQVPANGPAEPAPEPAAEPRGQSLPPASVAEEPRGRGGAPSTFTLSVPPARAAARAAQTPAQPWRWSAGLMGHATFGVSPALGYGGDLFVHAEAPRSFVLASAVRLGIFGSHCEVELPTGPSATFDWVAATLEGCPLRFSLTDLGVALQPCLALRAGVLHGEGHRISQPMQRFSLWTDVGAVLRLRFFATERVILEAQGAILMPLHRPTFEIVDMGQATSVYSVPSLGGSAGVGLAYGFR